MSTFTCLVCKDEIEITSDMDEDIEVTQICEDCAGMLESGLTSSDLMTDADVDYDYFAHEDFDTSSY
jgi:hypothetical protein